MPQLAGLPLYFENPVGRLYEHPDGYAIIAFNKGPRQFTVFQAFLQHLENLLVRHGWNKVLTDHRQLTEFTQQEHTFLHEHWLQLSHAVQQHMLAAVLVPSNQSVVEQQPARVGALVYQLFTDVSSAITWLRSAV